MPQQIRHSAFASSSNQLPAPYFILGPELHILSTENMNLVIMDWDSVPSSQFLRGVCWGGSSYKTRVNIGAKSKYFLTRKK